MSSCSIKNLNGSFCSSCFFFCCYWTHAVRHNTQVHSQGCDTEACICTAPKEHLYMMFYVTVTGKKWHRKWVKITGCYSDSAPHLEGHERQGEKWASGGSEESGLRCLHRVSSLKTHIIFRCIVVFFWRLPVSSTALWRLCWSTTPDNSLRWCPLLFYTLYSEKELKFCVQIPGLKWECHQEGCLKKKKNV